MPNMLNIARICLLFFLFLTSLSVFAKNNGDGSHIQPDNFYPKVKFETSMGVFIIELDRSKAPITANNFFFTLCE
jgi:peptidyl-prolyl cis-trans isomerase A (cyclophilin A)